MRNLSEKRTVFETLKVLLFKPVFGTIPRWFKLLNENLTSIFSVDEAMLKLFVFNIPVCKKRCKLSFPRATNGVGMRLPVTGSMGLSY